MSKGIEYLRQEIRDFNEQLGPLRAEEEKLLQEYDELRRLPRDRWTAEYRNLVNACWEELHSIRVKVSSIQGKIACYQLAIDSYRNEV